MVCSNLWNMKDTSLIILYNLLDQPTMLIILYNLLDQPTMLVVMIGVST